MATGAALGTEAWRIGGAGAAAFAGAGGGVLAAGTAGRTAAGLGGGAAGFAGAGAEPWRLASCSASFAACSALRASIAACIRQHTSAWSQHSVSMASAYLLLGLFRLLRRLALSYEAVLLGLTRRESIADRGASGVSIRQLTSAYVSIRHLTEEGGATPRLAGGGAGAALLGGGGAAALAGGGTGAFCDPNKPAKNPPPAAAWRFS